MDAAVLVDPGKCGEQPGPHLQTKILGRTT
jgi:hypothetical protein